MTVDRTPVFKRWRIVSTYDDDGYDLRIVEATLTTTREKVEALAQHVREFRAEQTQGPVVTIEEAGE